MRRRKLNRKKSFDWYGVSQRFSIRKYHFGAASVLLGTALLFGNATSVHAADENTEAVVGEAAGTENTATENTATENTAIESPTEVQPPVAPAAPVANSVSGSGTLDDATAIVDIPMTDANGADVSAPERFEALKDRGYQPDPNTDRYTYGIYDYSKANGKMGTEYYTTFSFTNDYSRADQNIYMNLVDKKTNQVVESITVTDFSGNTKYTFKTLDAFKDAGQLTSYYEFTPREATDDKGYKQKIIASFAEPDPQTEGGSILYNVSSPLKENIIESGSQVIDTQAVKQNTFYVVKNPDGTLKRLATWTNIGWGGETYTISGPRQFEGYELIESPKTTTGTFSTTRPVGFKWVDSTEFTLSNGDKLYREGEIVSEKGDAIYRMWRGTTLLYQSRVLQPGEMADDTGSTVPLTVNGISYIGARFEGPEGKAFKIQNTAQFFSNDVFYYYAPQGTVTVHYVDQAGNVLQDAVVDTPASKTGTNYDTAADNKPEVIEKDGVKYYQKEVATTGTVGGATVVEAKNGQVISTETGTVEASKFKNVIYIYEKEGRVVVNYVDEQGNVIKDAVVDTEGTKPGTDYDTAADNKPEVIEKDGVKYYQKAVATDGTVGGTTVVEVKDGVVVTNTEAGQVAAGTTTNVIYVYEKEGKVVVNYVDEQGNVIKDAVVDVPSAKSGEAYDTAADNKPEVIEKDGVKYYQKAVATDGTVGGTTVVEVKDGVVVTNTEAGQVTAGTTTNVIYVYEKEGKVVVNYVDEQGNVIKDAVEDVPSEKSGEAYDTAADNKPEVIEKDGVKYYQKVVATDGTVGGTTVVEVKDGVVVTNTEAGQVAAGTTTNVIYVYEKEGKVVVNYVDKAGNKLQEPVEDTPATKPGTEYDTAKDNKPEEIVTQDGKTYKLVPADTVGTEVGKVEAGKTTEVTYVYEEVLGKVIVNYVDEQGNVLKDPVNDELDKSTGTDYDTKDNKEHTIVKAGVTYVLVPEATKGNETGKVAKDPTEVTYVYAPGGDVVVNYVDKDGNVISPKVTDTPASKVGTEYDTAADYKLEEIVTQDGKTYKLLPDLTKGNEQGKVVAGTTEVTYVYEEVKGEVIVNYVDEAGNVIAAPVKDLQDASTGTGYDTADHKLPIINKDGKVYELVPVLTKGNEKGKVVAGTTEVTYIYKEVIPTTIYVDENGKELVPEKDGNHPFENVPGYELVTTKEDEKGNVTHVYKPNPNAITVYVDENGKVLVPEKGGSHPFENVPGYELVTTKVDEKGNVTHVYKPNPNATTTYVEENGKELVPGKGGSHPFENVPGYELVTTRVDEKGNVVHVYRPVLTVSSNPIDSIVSNKEESQEKVSDTEVTHTVSSEDVNVTTDKSEKVLPKTGETDASIGMLSGLGLLAGVVLTGRKRRRKER